MIDTKNLGRILNYLENKDENAKVFLEKFFRFRIKFIQRNEEILEELQEFENCYQFYLTDINFNFWIKISKGSITYHNGINRNPITTFELTKDLIIKLLKQEILYSEAYMKGLLKIRGSLSHAIKIRNFSKIIFKYINYYSEKK